jgi:MioC protein
VDIFVIVGSESGNAEMVADCVKAELESLSHGVEIFRDGGLDAARLADREIVLVISSSTGIGDMPQNVEPLYAQMLERRPALSHVRYGLVGLGDRSYKESFLGAPKKWDALFTELGAKRVGDRLELDATDNPRPDEDAVAWARRWVREL